MSESNWARILQIDDGGKAVAKNWIIDRIQRVDLSVISESGLEVMRLLVSDLQKLLEEFGKLCIQDYWTLQAIQEETLGINSGDPVYCWTVLEVIQKVSAQQNAGFCFTSSAMSPYNDYSVSSTSAGMSPNGHLQLPTYGIGNRSNSGYNEYQQSESGYSTNNESSIYSPRSSCSQLEFSPMDMSYGTPSPQPDVIGIQTEWSNGQLFEPLRPSALDAFQHQMKDVQNDIQKWNLELINMERDLELVERLDELFLSSIETKAGRIIKDLLIVPTQEGSKLLEEFIGSLFIVTKQPERLVQCKEKFFTEVRLLVPKDAILASPKGNTVSLRVINEEFKDPLGKSGLSGSFEMKLDRMGNGYSAEFAPVIPKTPKRMAKANFPDMMRVHDESFYLEYSGKIKLQDYSKTILVSTYSHPFKITVNSKQDPEALETLIWDNAAGRFGIFPFSTRPKRLKFIDIMKAINAYFKCTGNTFKIRDFEVVFGILNPRQASKLKSGTGQEEISLADFRLDTEVTGLDLKDKKISFWTWFFHLRKFILNHTLDLWKNGAILGYLTQEGSSRELSVKENGTFLIRFSNSTPNAVTVEWKEPGSKERSAGIYSYRGSATDLALHSLKDRIMDSFRWKIHHPSQLRKEDMIKTIQEGAVDLIPARSSTDSPRDLPRILGYVKAKIQAELIL